MRYTRTKYIRSFATEYLRRRGPSGVAEIYAGRPTELGGCTVDDFYRALSGAGFERPAWGIRALPRQEIGPVIRNAAQRSLFDSAAARATVTVKDAETFTKGKWAPYNLLGHMERSVLLRRVSPGTYELHPKWEHLRRQKLP